MGFRSLLNPLQFYANYSFELGKGRSTCSAEFPERFITPVRVHTLGLQRVGIDKNINSSYFLILPFPLKLDDLSHTSDFLSL